MIQVKKLLTVHLCLLRRASITSIPENQSMKGVKGTKKVRDEEQGDLGLRDQATKGAKDQRTQGTKLFFI